MNVEADLTPVKIDNLLPGWVKQAGKPARATYTLHEDRQVRALRRSQHRRRQHQRARRGRIDSNGDILSANFPVFSLSDGDKATLKADRGTDGVLRVVMRGDVYDGRNFVKSSLAGEATGARKQKQGGSSISTSSSARSPAITARRCAGSISSYSAAAAASAPSR